MRFYDKCIGKFRHFILLISSHKYIIIRLDVENLCKIVILIDIIMYIFELIITIM